MTYDLKENQQPQRFVYQIHQPLRGTIRKLYVYDNIDLFAKKKIL